MFRSITWDKIAWEHMYRGEKEAQDRALGLPACRGAVGMERRKPKDLEMGEQESVSGGEPEGKKTEGWQYGKKTWAPQGAGREPWAQGRCWRLLVMLDGIRSGRPCPGQGRVQGPRWREFSLGDKEVSVSSGSGAKTRTKRPNYVVGEEGAGGLGVLRQGGGEPSLTSAKSRITIQCIFQAVISPESKEGK